MMLRALILWLLLAFLAVPWLGLTRVADCFVIGALWLVLMLVLEVAFGRLVFHASWRRLAAEFDFRRGGLLSIGMCILFLAPLLAAKWRGLI